MGKLRAATTQRMQLKTNKFEVRSNGLGGDIYCMVGEELPLRLFSCRLQGGEVQIAVHDDGLRRVELYEEKKDILAAGTLGERPFR